MLPESKELSAADITGMKKERLNCLLCLPTLTSELFFFLPPHFLINQLSILKENPPNAALTLNNCIHCSTPSELNLRGSPLIYRRLVDAPLWKSAKQLKFVVFFFLPCRHSRVCDGGRRLTYRATQASNANRRRGSLRTLRLAGAAATA